MSELQDKFYERKYDEILRISEGLLGEEMTLISTPSGPVVMILKVTLIMHSWNSRNL
jgi:hypothetical protein